MFVRRILVGGLATSVLLACGGCTAQELAAMRASAAADASAGYQPPDQTFPSASPPAMSFDNSAPAIPPAPATALDPVSGRLLMSIGPGIYLDPTDGAVFPPGAAIPLGPQ
jgi:hypothetical protein